MAEKQPEFVVSDRRRFGAEGELRPDAQAVEEEKPATPPAAKPAAPPRAQATPPNPGPAPQKPVEQAPQSGTMVEEEELSAPPTAEEQRQQGEAYKASGKKIDDMIAAAGKTGQGPLEMTFERVVESFYMSALIQMGAIRSEGEPPRV